MVDCHMHVKRDEWPADSIVDYLDRNRIDYCWLLSWEEVSPGPWPYRHLSVEDIYEAYQKHPSRIIPFYAPDPHREDAADRLLQWSEKGIRGCGELKATLNWDTPAVLRLLATAERLRMPVLFHMEESRHLMLPRSQAILDRALVTALLSKRRRYFIPRQTLKGMVRYCSTLRNRVIRAEFPGYMLDFASLENALREYPGVNFVAHGPMFWKNISADAPRRNEVFPAGRLRGKGIIWRLLAENPNLYADISATSGLNALARDPASAREFLMVFEDKVLYGTDNMMLGQKEFLDSLGLSPATYRKIYGENARRLVDIQRQAPETSDSNSIKRPGRGTE